MTGAWGAWAPPLERTKLNGLTGRDSLKRLLIGFRQPQLAVNGASLGTLIIFTLSGYIAEHLGWAAVFYVTG